MARPDKTPDSHAPRIGGGAEDSTGLNARVSDEIMTGGGVAADGSRYRGFDWIASLLGFAVAMFFVALFLGIVGATLGALGYRPASGSLTATLSSPAGQAAVAGSLAAILLAYLIGGYAAGRLARYSGGRNGLGVVLWTAIVGVLLGIAGVILQMRFGLSRHVHLGIGLSHTPVPAFAAGALTALVVMVLGVLVGGAFGTRYHRRVDRAAGVTA